jgi:signal transduction histidine kinase
MAIPLAVSTSVYRIAQEGLTNAMRHGRPSCVRLSVERAPSTEGDVAIVIEDDGGGAPDAMNAATGHGILGMRERVAALGGSLFIGRAVNGFRIAATIPLASGESGAEELASA